MELPILVLASIRTRRPQTVGDASSFDIFQGQGQTMESDIDEDLNVLERRKKKTINKHNLPWLTFHSIDQLEHPAAAAYISR
jgi:hypothetical protein